MTKHFREVLATQGLRLSDIQTLFGLDRAKLSSREEPVRSVTISPALHLFKFSSVRQIPREEWTLLVGNTGMLDHETLRLLEEHQLGKGFGDDWEFLYFVVWDVDNCVVCALFFINCVWKEGRVLMNGSVFNLGDPNYFDKTKDWQQGTKLIISEVQKKMKSTNATKMLLRPQKGEDNMAEFLKAQGFAWQALPNTFEATVYRDKKEWTESLNNSNLQFMKDMVLGFNSKWRVDIVDKTNPASDAVFDHCMQLYQNTLASIHENSTLPIPRNFVQSLAQSDSWELLLLTPVGSTSGLPAGFAAYHNHGGVYFSLLYGIDCTFQDQAVHLLL